MDYDYRKKLMRRLNPLNNKNINLQKETIKFKYPLQKLLNYPKHISHPSLINSQSDFNMHNVPIENDNYISYLKRIKEKKINPIVSRVDLSKYLINPRHYILKNVKKSHSIEQISNSYNKKNTKLYIKKGLPLINNNKIYNQKSIFEPKLNQNSLINSYQSRNRNNMKKNESENIKINNIKISQEKLENEKNKISPVSICYIPKIPRLFHKTQIFDGCKPYLSDDYTLLA